MQGDEGHGTQILLSLPSSEGVQVSEERPARGLPPSPKRILLVEDDAAVLDVEIDLLRSDGHNVVAAPTGQDGLRKFREGAFDLVLVDRALPDMSGDQVALAIKAMAAKQLVILVTGFGDIMKATGERPPGVDLVVSKPITLSTLREAIAQATS